MSPRLFRFLVLGIAAVLAWLAADWYLSPQKRLERRLTHLQRLVAHTPAESDLAAFATARDIGDLFAEPFEVMVHPEGFSTSDRQSLVSGVHQYRSRTSTLVMEISSLQIFLEPRGSAGNTFFQARFLTDPGDLRTGEHYDVRMHWTEVDGAWLIDHVQVSSTGS